VSFRALSLAARVVALMFCLPLAGCLSTPPPHPRALECNELCARYIDAANLVQAEVQCDLGLQFSPQYADLWVNKGLIALRRSQEDKAKEFFIKALRYNQEQAQAYNNLGYIYLSDKAYGKAHDNFQRALKVNPDYTEARYNLALAYKGLKDLDKAKKELRTIIAINGTLADPHAQLGVIFSDEGSYDEAIAELRAATELDAKYAEAWGALGSAYSEVGKFAEAREAFTSCIEADPENIPCRNSLPVVARKEKLAEPALKEVAENLKGQKTANGEFALARNYKKKGLRNEEERAYRRCLRLDSKYAPCHYGLFEIFQEDRKDKDAQSACKNFLKYAEAAEFAREVETCQRFVSQNTY
jgi:tetratricopeptide (TPR) repeat protein